MNLFHLSKNKVEVNPSTLTLKEFNALWTRDKSKTKTQAIKEFSYIYFNFVLQEMVTL